MASRKPVKKRNSRVDDRSCSKTQPIVESSSENEDCDDGDGEEKIIVERYWNRAPSINGCESKAGEEKIIISRIWNRGKKIDAEDECGDFGPDISFTLPACGPPPPVSSCESETDSDDEVVEEYVRRKTRVRSSSRGERSTSRPRDCSSSPGRRSGSRNCGDCKKCSTSGKPKVCRKGRGALKPSDSVKNEDCKLQRNPKKNNDTRKRSDSRKRSESQKSADYSVQKNAGKRNDSKKRSNSRKRSDSTKRVLFAPRDKQAESKKGCANPCPACSYNKKKKTINKVN